MKFSILAFAMMVTSSAAQAQCSSGDYINTCPILNASNQRNAENLVTPVIGYNSNSPRTNGPSSEQDYRYGTFITARILPIQSRLYAENTGLASRFGYIKYGVNQENVFLYNR